MQTNTIDNKADQILRAAGTPTLPIKVEDYARSYGLKVIAYPLEDNVSGILVIENGVGMIGYNQSESKVRRRFTVAHEFGHFILHQNESTLFVDKMFRASKGHPAYNASTAKLEQDANEFAAALLMPERELRKEVDRLELDLGDEEGLNQLAKIFDVSTATRYYRLFNLHLI